MPAQPKGEKGALETKVDDLGKLMYYVIIILIVMVATLLVTVGGIVISAFQNQSASYQSLITEIQSLKTASVPVTK